MRGIEPYHVCQRKRRREKRIKTLKPSSRRQIDSSIILQLRGRLSSNVFHISVGVKKIINKWKELKSLIYWIQCVWREKKLFWKIYSRYYARLMHFFHVAFLMNKVLTKGKSASNAITSQSWSNKYRSEWAMHTITFGCMNEGIQFYEVQSKSSYRRVLIYGQEFWIEATDTSKK